MGAFSAPVHRERSADAMPHHKNRRSPPPPLPRRRRRRPIRTLHRHRCLVPLQPFKLWRHVGFLERHRQERREHVDEHERRADAQEGDEDGRRAATVTRRRRPRPPPPPRVVEAAAEPANRVVQRLVVNVVVKVSRTT